MARSPNIQRIQELVAWRLSTAARAGVGNRPPSPLGFGRLALFFGWLWLATAGGSAPAPEATTSREASELLEVTGTVELSRANEGSWRAARVHDLLAAGDRLRTLRESRATLRLSDRSLVRVHEWSVLEIQSAAGPGGKRRLKLERGTIFFLHRERPNDLEFETPLATGAIRGTEFVLRVAETDGTTRLTLFDGEVQMRSPATGAEVRVVSGQDLQLTPGKSPKLQPALPLRQSIQWTFYYPAVLNPDDLPLEPAEKSQLGSSLAAYREGSLAEALASLPAMPPNPSASWVGYAASLKLSMGLVDAAERLAQRLPRESPIAVALTGLMAAVRGEPWASGQHSSTSTELLAKSYYEQSRSQLEAAREAARQAVQQAPQFGFAWARLAELEFGFGERHAARAALDQARQLSPRNAHARSVQGFVDLEDQLPHHALDRFNEAITLDPTLSIAWLGRGLANQALGDASAGLTDLQTAAALEPQRALLRSYLGKAWGRSREDTLANREFQLAKDLDPADPTAWLYSGLHRHQTHRLNQAIQDLEQSIARNDNRSLFRSRSLLDRDRSIRSADLASIYQEAGLEEVGLRAARQAIEDSPANFSGHLFLSRSLRVREDPFDFNLRLQTVRQSEQLVANLLAPSGGGNLSQVLSQQDRLRFFEAPPIGVSTFAEYRSPGDARFAGTAFGQVEGLSYAVDGQTISLRGDRPNNQFDQFGYSVQAKQQLSVRDSAYVQVGTSHLESGDVAQYYDPRSAKLSLRAEEWQNPYLHVGFHHEWSPRNHTLLLLSRIPDRFALEDPEPNVLFLQRSGGNLAAVSRDPFFHLNLNSEFTLHSTELQQLWANDQHAVQIGGRYQWSAIDTAALLTRGISGLRGDDHLNQDLQRISGYAYYHWRPVEWVSASAGATYDHLKYPRNLDLPPLTPGQESRSRVSPKLGLTLTPWINGSVQLAWTRSLGGVYFDDAVRLEPTHTAGFIHSYRSLIPESAVGLVPGTEFETWGAGFDQKFPTRTYAGLRAERLTSTGSRSAGAFYNAGIIPEPEIATSTRQTLDFEENSLSVYLSQLIGADLTAGARYRLSEAKLRGRFPQLPSQLPGLASLEQTERAVLGNLSLQAAYQHESGFFAQWTSDWFHQSNAGYQTARPGDRFWQHSVYMGWKFRRRQAEVRLGIVNLTDQDYRLNPLNNPVYLSRERTFISSLRLNF